MYWPILAGAGGGAVFQSLVPCPFKGGGTPVQVSFPGLIPVLSGGTNFFQERVSIYRNAVLSKSWPEHECGTPHP